MAVLRRTRDPDGLRRTRDPDGLRRTRDPDGRMSLGEHFREFRRRALIAAIAIAIGAVVGWLKFDTVYQWMINPLLDAARHRHVPDSRVSTNFGRGVGDAFSIKLKVSVWLGFIIASPVWLWEIWAFLAPGLTRKEKRVGAAFILSAVPLFLLGCWVATRTIPNAVVFLISQTPSEGTNFIDAQTYIAFIIKFVLAFGLAFLLPVFLVGLNGIRVLPARVMLKGWRIAVMLIFVFAAVMSPSPDAWSMLALAFPMVALYFGGRRHLGVLRSSSQAGRAARVARRARRPSLHPAILIHPPSHPDATRQILPGCLAHAPPHAATCAPTTRAPSRGPLRCHITRSGTRPRGVRTPSSPGRSAATTRNQSASDIAPNRCRWWRLRLQRCSVLTSRRSAHVGERCLCWLLGRCPGRSAA